MKNNDPTRLSIDIVSDVVCPWCIIGYKQLEQALAATETAATIHWHPFELNPDLGDEGQDLQEHLAAKYGTTPEGSQRAREALTAMGSELGFTFDYSGDMKMRPTFRAHQLLHWADAEGQKHDLTMALFAAYFSHRRNVNDPEVLAKIAEQVGLDKARALAVLADGRYAEAVRNAERSWTSRGIRAVPAMIFDGRYLVPGAQGVETYSTILRQQLAKREEQEQASA